MSIISLGSGGIIGISYRETSLLKSSLLKASEKSSNAASKVNAAKMKLQIDSGSNRIRVESQNLQSYYNRLKKNSTSVEKIIKDVDYIVRRFKEVDSRCANRVKSIGQGYKIQASISKIGNSLMAMGNNVVGGVTTFFQNGVSAIKSMCSSVSTWFGEHPVVGNIISGVLNGLAIVGCGLAIVAEAPVIAVVGAVVGIALAANSLIDDGVKIYNNISNGNNSGLNLIKDGLKWATGDKAGEAIYTAVNVIDLALNIPHMVKGLVKGGKSIIKSGSSIKNFFKKGPMIIGDFKDGASKSIDELVDGIGNIMSPKREYAGIGKISQKDINNLSKVDIKPITKNDVQNNYNKIVNEGNDIEGVRESTNGILRTTDDLLKETTCSNDKLYQYLKSNDEYLKTNYADQYLDTGKWPDDIQIPKSSDVLTSKGSIDWSQVPDSGYMLDSSGKAINETYFPKKGEVIDRYGPSNGTFTSPVIDGKAYSYDNRSLPYIDDLGKYHQYELTDDLSKLSDYITNCTDKDLVQDINDFMAYKRIKSYNDLISYKGKIASGFGASGGGIQYQLPLSVDILEELGLLKIIK